MTNNSGTGSNTAVAIEQLRDLIFAGQLGAGTDHLESELAEQLGMSRTPIREALLRLEAQGLVEVRPRKGARVKPFSHRDITEVYDILAELEALAAGDAATRLTSQDELEPLAAAIADMNDALRQDNREAWVTADDAFHRTLVRLGNNSRTMQTAKMLRDQIHRARMVTLYIQPLPVNAIANHSRVLEAIRAGNSPDAREAQRQNRLVAKDILIDLLTRHRLSNI